MLYCVNSMMCPHAVGVKYADTVYMQHIMMAAAHAVVSPAQAGWLEFRAAVGLAHQARKLNRRKEGISNCEAWSDEKNSAHFVLHRVPSKRAEAHRAWQDQQHLCTQHLVWAWKQVQQARYLKRSSS